uniref:Uncharacterized protein n=1 Tax=Trypanosoma congolense (strain IL3000) TaxID=1068625 RepID=G0UQN2_TRYCI|nr:hypothetical protein TCIL3000_7_5070 [Trypanosoma congolense IL3000]
MFGHTQCSLLPHYFLIFSLVFFSPSFVIIIFSSFLQLSSPKGNFSFTFFFLFLFFASCSVQYGRLFTLYRLPSQLSMRTNELTILRFPAARVLLKSAHLLYQRRTGSQKRCLYLFNLLLLLPPSFSFLPDVYVTLYDIWTFNGERVGPGVCSSRIILSEPPLYIQDIT